ncbi:MAG TPA: energy transducer TonB [Fluviicola sp.]|nr:energy transducer TonB [Fluviicola sp.]
MKTSILFLFLFLGLTSWSQPDPEPLGPPPPEKMQEDPNTVYEYAEQPAEFPGGKAAMQQYLETHVVLPDSVVNGKIAGKCYVRFIVEKDGSLSEIKIARGVKDCPECDKEAIRVVKSMPKWKPGKMNGKAVRLRTVIQIVFKPD